MGRQRERGKKKEVLKMTLHKPTLSDERKGSGAEMEKPRGPVREGERARVRMREN